MIRFDGQLLFDSGPSRLAIGGVAIRQVTQPTLESRGVHMASQGLEGRSIVQRGTLTADSIKALREQREAIEMRCDGLPHELVDRFHNAWPNVIMLRFAPEAPERLGPRWKLDYRIDYEQLLPGGDSTM